MIKFSPNGEYMATASLDRSINIINAKNKRLIKRLINIHDCKFLTSHS